MSKNIKEMQDRSDEELMVLYQMSNEIAFEVLYHRHSARIFSYLNKKVGIELSQELLQDVFARIHKSRDQYNSQYPFLPWVFTIARNILFDHFKKAETQTVVNSNSIDNYEIPSENNLADFTNLDQLNSLLSLLPETQRLALKLRYLDDWSFEKIASEIQTTPENVRQMISRGLKKVKMTFEKKEIHK